MKNADQPVYPQQELTFNLEGQAMSGFALQGLTKREAFAMAAMQGLLANGEFLHAAARAECSGESTIAEETKRNALACADALLSALEEPRDDG